MMTKTIAILVLLFAFTVSTAETPKEHLSNSDAFRLHVSALCKANKIADSVVYGVIGVESRGDQYAVGADGELGLMQVKQELAPEEDLRDPFTNTRVGIQYLGLLKARKGSERMALLCYNLGPGKVSRLLSDGKPYDNGYARRVYRASKQTMTIRIN
jgi:soluble lytic murein transglycosylase-like protein